MDLFSNPYYQNIFSTSPNQNLYSDENLIQGCRNENLIMHATLATNSFLFILKGASPQKKKTFLTCLETSAQYGLQFDLEELKVLTTPKNTKLRRCKDFSCDPKKL